MVVLDKKVSIKEIDIFIDKDFLDEELREREKEYLIKWWLTFKDSYKKTMNFISSYNN